VSLSAFCDLDVFNRIDFVRRTFEAVAACGADPNAVRAGAWYACSLSQCDGTPLICFMCVLF
jgi:hypothetical protein